MSQIKFFPIHWFEEDNWKSIQVIGELENKQPIYLKINFKPYFTIKYSCYSDNIIEEHNYLLSETSIYDIKLVENNIYRIYVLDKKDYYDSIKLYKNNGLGIILDEDQDIKSKFFSERKLLPGSWQLASNLRTIPEHIYDLEYSTNDIISFTSQIPLLAGRIVFLDGLNLLDVDRNLSFSNEQDLINEISLIKPNRIVTFGNKIKYDDNISYIDLEDYYKRKLPHLENHKLETISKIVLKKEKHPLVLYELWVTDKIEEGLSSMSNEWRNDIDYVLTHKMKDLFDDLIKPNTPEKCKIDKMVSERKEGTHCNVYVYSLSDIYLLFLESVSPTFAAHFKGTNDAYIPFSSGYFPLSFHEVKCFLEKHINKEKIIWIEDNTFAVKDGINFLQPVSYYRLIIIHNKSWIILDGNGLVFKKGLSSFVRPPFKLIGKYIEYYVRFILEHPNEEFKYPNIETTLDDFVLEEKVIHSNFLNASSKKGVLVQQLSELNIPIPKESWRKVRYIKTTKGDIVEEIYMKNSDLYVPILDLDYYNNTLYKTLKSIM